MPRLSSPPSPCAGSRREWNSGMWGRLAAWMVSCAPVGYRRFPASTRGVPSGSGRLPIGRRLTICPTTAPPHIRYTLIGKVTSTEFRKNLFQIVERVLQGELVEVAHKGRLIRLVPVNKPSKLSRLVKR